MTVATERGTTGAKTVEQVNVLAADAQDLAMDLQATAHQIEEFLTEQVRTNPYRTLLVAAGAGYVLGGGLASTLTREVMRLAFRSMGPSMLAATLVKGVAAVSGAPDGGRPRKTQRKGEGENNDAG